MSVNESDRKDEIFAIIFKHAPWDELVTWSSLSTSLRELAQLEARARLQHDLAPMMELMGCSFDKLLLALSKSGGGVVGSYALRTLYHGTEFRSHYASLPRLTIVVPYGKDTALINTLGLQHLPWIWKEVNVAAGDAVSAVKELEMVPEQEEWVPVASAHQQGTTEDVTLKSGDRQVCSCVKGYADADSSHRVGFFK
ncbi:hypothetical protein CC2G_000227 [Coprinopsis cinerea AmutBmut pab1-1]|nr:hypothetical protein CC2G_000227 [Coprinopsis cinerea AmutBmut pab1-1]